MIHGTASVQGTEKMPSFFPELSYQPLSGSGVLVSQVGYGAHRINSLNSNHLESLQNALRSGINLIDTAGSYGDGEADQLIGHVLKEEIDAGRLERERVVIVSKGGYFVANTEDQPTKDQANHRENSSNKLIFGYNFSKKFLKEEINRNRERLGLATLDVFLLHNPEEWLRSVKLQNGERLPAYAHFLELMKEAFTTLEEAVDEGLIGSYGISSNSLSLPRDQFEFIDLADLWQLADSLTNQHHFGWVQMPLNVMEPQAVLEPNQNGRLSAIAFAKQKEMTVLTNRPFDVVLNNLWIRLADPPAMKTNEVTDSPTEQLDAFEQQEEDLLFLHIPRWVHDVEQQEQFRQSLSFAGLTRKFWTNFTSRHHWREVLQQLDQRLQVALDQIEAVTDSEEARLTLTAYREQATKTWAAIDAHYWAQSHRILAGIREQLERDLPREWPQAPTLSQLALRPLRLTDGVHCVLVGMRHPRYVRDVLNELRLPLERLDPNFWPKRAQQHSSFNSALATAHTLTSP